MTWQLTLVGLFTGLLVGMTGMGGGSLMTPILVFLFGIPPSTAIGTDIAHGAAFKTVERSAAPAHGERPRAARRAGCSSARRPASLARCLAERQLTERYGDDVEVGHGAGARRCAALRRRRPDREERRAGRCRPAIPTGASRTVTASPRAHRSLRRLHRRPDLRRKRRLLRTDAARRSSRSAHTRSSGRTSSTRRSCSTSPERRTGPRGTSTSASSAGSCSARSPACSSAAA